MICKRCFLFYFLGFRFFSVYNVVDSRFFLFIFYIGLTSRYPLLRDIL